MGRPLMLAIILQFGLAFRAGSTFAADLSSNASYGTQGQSSEVVKDQSGDTFMEEIPAQNSPPPQTYKRKIVPDFSSIGVPVDPNGNIVPIKNTEAGPLLPFYSQFQQTVEPLYQPFFFQPLPGMGYYPYGGMPNYGGNWYPYGSYGFRTGSTFGFGLNGAALRFGSSARPYVPEPYAPLPSAPLQYAPLPYAQGRYAFGPASPWFAPPVMMPGTMPGPSPAAPSVNFPPYSTF
jgi:hypothetical protein